MTNYNEGGTQYSVYPFPAPSAARGYLPDETVLRKHGLMAAIAQTGMDEGKHEWLSGYLGVVHHLDGLLLTVERFVELLQVLQGAALSPVPNPIFPRVVFKKAGHNEGVFDPPFLIGISSERIEVETETFLLKAVGLLERLYRLVAKECGLNDRSSFFRFEEELTADGVSDARRNDLLSTLRLIKPRLLGTLVSDGQTKSLRNLIAHRASTPEMMDKAIALNVPTAECMLPFDAEIGDYPLVNTMHSLAEAVPHIVMEMTRILLTATDEGTPLRAWANEHAYQAEDFKPTWNNPFIHFSSFIDPDENGPIVSVFRWKPGGLQPHQRHLKEEVMNHGVPLIQQQEPVQ